MKPFSLPLSKPWLSLRLLCAAILIGPWSPARAVGERVIPDIATKSIELVRDVHGTWNQPPEHVPNGKMPDGPVLGNGDLGVVLGGKADHLTFYVGKSDFFGVLKGGMSAVGTVDLNIPELANTNPYQIRQNIGPATLTAQFGAAAGPQLSMKAWVASEDNLLVIELKNGGT